MKTKGQEVRQEQITIKNLLRLPSYIARGVKYHAAGRIYTPKPVHSTFRVTRRCNSRCIMCSDWKRQDSDKELTLTEIAQIYKNPLFGSVEKFVLSGGEPTLREDLVQIAQTVLDACPRIKEMSLLTNGLEPTLVMEKVKELLALSDRKGLSKFSVSVSLDGHGVTCQRIRRVPQAFERVTETITRLKGLQRKTPFYLCSTCVVQPLNVNNLVQLSEFGQELGLPIIFSPVCVSNIFVKNTASDTSLTSLRLSDDQLKELKIVFNHQLQPNLMPSNVHFWREYFNIIDGEKRRLPCYLLHHFAGVDSDGTLYVCAADSSLVYGNLREAPPDKLWYSDGAREMRKRVEKYFCPRCIICCDIAFSLSQEFFYYAKSLLKEKSRKLLRR